MGANLCGIKRSKLKRRKKHGSTSERFITDPLPRRHDLFTFREVPDDVTGDDENHYENMDRIYSAHSTYGPISFEAEFRGNNEEKKHRELNTVKECGSTRHIYSSDNADTDPLNRLHGRFVVTKVPEVNSNDDETGDDRCIYEDMDDTETYSEELSKAIKRVPSFDSAYDGEFTSTTSLFTAKLNDSGNRTSLFHKNRNQYGGLPDKIPVKGINGEESNVVKEVVPDNLVPKMVEAFRPLIVECIRVKEVLPYLPFLADSAVIEAKERESPKQAVGLLLDQIIDSDELGKWTTFINALKTVGYQYVANTLLGITELDQTIQKNLIKVFIPNLINNIKPNELLDDLFSKDVISEADKEEIECELRNRGSSAASLMLLDRIPRRIENWYSEFLSALRGCGFAFLADTIDIKGVSDTSSSGCPSATSCSKSQVYMDYNSYITPDSSTSGSFTLPRPPPLPNKSTSVSYSAKCRLKPNKLAPSPSEAKENKQLAFRKELMKRKQRLMIELEDAKQMRILKKEIKCLEKQLEKVVNEESDDDCCLSDTEQKLESLPINTKPDKKLETKVEKDDKEFIVTHTSGKTAENTERLQLSNIKLSEISLACFKDMLNSQISKEIQMIVKDKGPNLDVDEDCKTNIDARKHTQMAGNLDMFSSVFIDIDQAQISNEAMFSLRQSFLNIDITKNRTRFYVGSKTDMLNVQPNAHKGLQESASDSGIYSGYLV